MTNIEMKKGNKIFHKLDLYLGTLIVFILGLFRKKRELLSHQVLKRFALINLGSIGGNELMSAVIEDLKSQCADAEIVVFTGDPNYDIANLKNGVTVIKLPIKNFFIDFGPWLKL